MSKEEIRKRLMEIVTDAVNSVMIEVEDGMVCNDDYEITDIIADLLYNHIKI